ncbi:unnamed protein product [Rotaria sp. Silwood1]|nr:unnamed protein product [Rotaria sp. Silwood1]CAF3752512.1 unnamed protein product [Rotaria sp. Silwood1]CAF4874591.1 unnamed protein product [Rotaria sp. Silwood1]
MSIILFYLILLSFSLTQSCNIFVGMTCTCYESIDIRCTMSKQVPLTLISSIINKNFQSIDIKFNTNENIQLDSDYFILLNQLFTNTTQYSLTITLRFQNFDLFHAKTAAFRNLFQGINTPYSRLIIELHPIKAKSIIFESNTFDNIHINELSIYADSLTSSFESIFNNTNIMHLNIEGATVIHDPLLVSTFTGHIQSLKVTRMIDIVNSEEFPSFPVQSYTIEAHKMRKLDALSFLNYKQLTGLNIIQPDVSITPKILYGLENLSNLRSISFDAEHIADGALKYVKHIQTLILGPYLKMLDTESLNSLTSLQQLDVRYVQFSTLQANTSCALADYINRRRLFDLIVYLPQENMDCDCILIFLNNMINNNDNEQIRKCQSSNNDRCLFSSCSIVSEYFTRKQKENDIIQVNTPSIITPSIVSPLIDFNEQDSQFYPDSQEERTTIKIYMEPNIYDDEEVFTDTISITTITTTTTTSQLITSEESINQFSTPFMKRLIPEVKTYGSTNYLIVSWIPFAIIASCLFLSLVIAMVSYIIYHKQHTVSFKLIPQTLPII